MVSIRCIVAALLISGLTSTAEAADNTGTPLSEKARKAEILLGALGVNSKDARAFIADVDSRIEDNTLNFMKERVDLGPVASGTLKFHYRLDQGVGMDNLEIQYAPDKGNWKAVGRKDSVMFHYKYTF